LKKRYNENAFVDIEFVLELLKTESYKCSYCQNGVLINYDIVREMNQWSLDRKQNDIGHNRGNVVVSCLKCNLNKRKMNENSFRFTKQLVIQQLDCSQDPPRTEECQELNQDLKKISCRMKE